MGQVEIKTNKEKEKNDDKTVSGMGVPNLLIFTTCFRYHSILFVLGTLSDANKYFN